METERLAAVAAELQSGQPQLTPEQARTLAATILGQGSGRDAGVPPAVESAPRCDVDAKVRLLALAADAGILGLLCLVITGLIMITLHENPLFPYQLIAPSVTASYFVVCWGTFGCTGGMYAADLRLVAVRGGRPGLGRAVLRLALVVATCVPFAVGWLSVPLSSDHRALYDRLAGTRLVRRPGPED